MTPVAGLFEAHLTVSDLGRSVAFYRDVVGLEVATELPEIGAAFLWVGEPGAAMLGLWKSGSAPMGLSLHVAFKASLSDVLNATERLRGLGITPLSFDATETDEPSVIGWMPAAAIYFRDPDGNLLEYLAMLDAPPDPERRILRWSEWVQPTAPAVNAEIDVDQTRSEADRAAICELIQTFLRAVSFEEGGRPAYGDLPALFIDGARLIRNSGAAPEISTVDEFVRDRQRALDAGELLAFEEVELDETTELFGNIAHRFSPYAKRGSTDRGPIATRGVISTQFVRTEDGWRISSMAWDDERPGLVLSDSRSVYRLSR